MRTYNKWMGKNIRREKIFAGENFRRGKIFAREKYSSGKDIRRGKISSGKNFVNCRKFRQFFPIRYIIFSTDNNIEDRKKGLMLLLLGEITSSLTTPNVQVMIVSNLININYCVDCVNQENITVRKLQNNVFGVFV